MKTFLVVLVLLMFAVVALGFYRGWFRVSMENTEQRPSATITVDQNKIAEDENKAKNRRIEIVLLPLLLLYFFATFAMANLESTFALMTNQVFHYGNRENAFLFTYIGVLLGGGTLYVDFVDNRPPLFTSTPVIDANVNTSYTYQAAATDPDGDSITFSVVSGPQGLKIDPTSGSVTWSPTADQLGTSHITLKADDGSGGSANHGRPQAAWLVPPRTPDPPLVPRNVPIAVTPAPTPPIIVTAGPRLIIPTGPVNHRAVILVRPGVAGRVSHVHHLGRRLVHGDMRHVVHGFRRRNLLDLIHGNAFGDLPGPGVNLPGECRHGASSA